MRMGEFWEAMDAHNKEKEADRRHIGELVRGATLRLYNTQVMKCDRIADPVKFWRMPWDDITTADEELKDFESMTDEQKAASSRNFIKKVGW